jgi:hypothetical protein
VVAAAGALFFLGATATAGAQTPDPDGFAVAGTVDGLYPGVQTTVHATVTNPQTFTISVTSVGVTSLDASPQCPGSLLEFGDETTAVDVAPGATATVPVAVSLDAGAPDACQGATWPLEFVGTAAGDGPAAGSGSGGGSLALTGTNVFGLALAGLVLVAAGIGARLTAHRQRKSV